MDDETYNRLFILGGKGCSEDEWRSAFEPFGNITHIQVVTDRKTGEQKGIVYISYEKISEAAKALEEMNGKFLPKYPKPLKVMIASSKKEGNVKDPKEDEKILRLFIVCEKNSTEDDLREHFAQFGETEYIRILRDRATKESKGLAYVKYFRAYHAALAFEGCNQKYNPRFAELKSSRDRRDMGGHAPYGGSGGSLGGAHGYRDEYVIPPPIRRGSGGGDGRSGGYGDLRGQAGLLGDGSGGRGGSYSSMAGSTGSRGSYDMSPLNMLANYPHVGECCLEAMVMGCTQEQVYKLFDIIPGLESFDYDRSSGIVYVKYQTPSLAAYAKDKVSGFEYPSGEPIIIRYPDSRGEGGVANTVNDLNTSMSAIASGEVDGNLSTLVKSIQKATEVLQKAGLGAALGGGAGGVSAMDTGDGTAVGAGLERVRWCNVPLAYRQPLEPKDSTCEERLFIVSQPEAFPDHVLVDLLCRFGGLIDAYFMPGKNYGYAKFASLESAKNAQDTLHGQTICNMRLKVIHADPPKFDNDDDKNRKRPRT